MRCLLLSLTLLLLPPVAFALDFKGIELGEAATQDEIKEKIGVSCGEGPNFNAVCNGPTTILGSQAYMNLVIGKSGKVMRISLDFNSHEYSRVAQALIEKFGKPNKIEKKALQNAMGAQFQQESLIWIDGDKEARLDKYASKITRSSLYMSTEEDRELWVSPIFTDTFIKLVKIEGNVRDDANGITQEIQSGVQIRSGQAGDASRRGGQFGGQGSWH